MTTLSELRQAQLQEATNQLSVNGVSNLTQIIIDRLLFEQVRKYAPLRRALPRKTIVTKDFRFNTRLTLPDADMVQEAPALTDVPATNSTFSQGIYPIKHTQAQLDISKFSAEVANVNGNLYDLEIAAAAKALAYREEVCHLFGNSFATVNTKHPEWDGLDFQIANGNKIDGGSQLITTKMLDNMIDSITSISSEELGDGYFFMMGSRMQSAINQQFVAQERFDVSATRMFARDDYGFPQGAIADNGIDAGIEVQTYRGIPIVKSSFLSNVGQMGVVGTAASGSGSQLTGTTYYYVMEAVTREGLSVASAEVSQAATAGQNITLTWTTPTILNVLSQPVKISAYRIFRSTTSGTESLYAVLSARDATDTAVTSFIDSGTPAPTNGIYATFAQSGNAAIPDGYTFPRSQVQVNGVATNVQDVFLIPRNPEYCVVPVFKEITTVPLAPTNARTTQISLIADLTLALRAPAFAAKLERVRYQ